MSPSGGVEQELHQKKSQQAAEMQHGAEESLRQTGVVGRKKPPKSFLINKTPASLSNNSPMSPTDVKAKNTGLYGSVSSYCSQMSINRH